MQLNPLAIFNCLGQSTFVDSELMLLPDVTRREKLCAATHLPPLTCERLASPTRSHSEAFVACPGDLREVESVVGKLKFKSITLLEVQELYLAACENGTVEALPETARVVDTVCKRAYRRQEFATWKKGWSNQSKESKHVAYKFRKIGRCLELHSRFATRVARERARACHECAICYEAPSVFPSCGHALCRRCRNGWRRDTCPLCRSPTPTWFSNRFTLASLLKQIFEAYPGRDILYFDRSLSESNLEKARTVVKGALMRRGGNIVECHNTLSSSAESDLKSPVIVVAGMNRSESVIFAIRYLRSCFGNGESLPAYVCRPAGARIRKS